MPIRPAVALPPIHPFVDADIRWLWRQAVRNHGAKPFLTWDSYAGDVRSWTYAEAYADIRRIAAGLRRRGVACGDAVILHLENSPESILAWLACGELGAVGVTTNSRCAGEELAYFAEKSQAVGIVTQPQFEAMVREHLPTLGWTEIIPPGRGVELIGADDDLPERAADPAAPFSVQFTSGSTARPKGAVWTHANALWGAMVNARHIGVRSTDVALIANPLCHTMAQAWQALSAIWVGAQIVVTPRPSGEHFWDTVVRYGCTWTSGGSFTRRAVAGQPVPEHRLRFLLNVVNEEPSSDSWGLRVFGGHGMTEVITQDLFSDPDGPFESMTLGRPAAEYELAIRSTAGTPCAPGQPGELLLKGVRGLSIFAEYLNDPEGTAAAFTADGYFRTGDVVTMRPDGVFVFVDRLKDMLRVGGENVAASEVETVVLRVTGVQEVAVVGQPHERLGEVPFAFVVPAPGAPHDLAERIVAACREALAGFKVPRSVRLIEDMPRAVGAKVHKPTLRTILREEAGA